MHWYHSFETIECQTPSRNDNVDFETEARYRKEGARFIMELGNKLGLRYLTMATGIVFFHRFYMFHSFKEFSKWVTGATCLFLAGKVEETPKKCRDILKFTQQTLSDSQFKTFGENPREELMICERILLQTIKFDLQTNHPYEFLIKYGKVLKGEKNKINEFVQKAWIFINDSLSTPLCLVYKPQVVALAVLMMAFKLSNQNIREFMYKSRVDWWKSFYSEVNEKDLEEISKDLMNMYEGKPPRRRFPNKHLTKAKSDSASNSPQTPAVYNNPRNSSSPLSKRQKVATRATAFTSDSATDVLTLKTSGDREDKTSIYLDSMQVETLSETKNFTVSSPVDTSSDMSTTDSKEEASELEVSKSINLGRKVSVDEYSCSTTSNIVSVETQSTRKVSIKIVSKTSNEDILTNSAVPTVLSNEKEIFKPILSISTQPNTFPSDYQQSSLYQHSQGQQSHMQQQQHVPLLQQPQQPSQKQLPQIQQLQNPQQQHQSQHSHLQQHVMYQQLNNQVNCNQYPVHQPNIQQQHSAHLQQQVQTHPYQQQHHLQVQHQSSSVSQSTNQQQQQSSQYQQQQLNALNNHATHNLVQQPYLPSAPQTNNQSSHPIPAPILDHMSSFFQSSQPPAFPAFTSQNQLQPSHQQQYSPFNVSNSVKIQPPNFQQTPTPLKPFMNMPQQGNPYMDSIQNNQQAFNNYGAGQVHLMQHQIRSQQPQQSITSQDNGIRTPLLPQFQGRGFNF